MSLQEGVVAGVYSTMLEQTGRGDFVTHAVPELVLDLQGIVGNRHHGPLRAAGPREPWLPKGALIRNDRQLSILSVEELALIAAGLALPQSAPELIGANLVVEGIAALSRIAPGSHLAFGGIWGGRGKFDGGAVLRVEAYNRPCRGPGRKLAEAHARPELEFDFVKAAASLRGLVLSVTHPGMIRPGDAVIVVGPLTAP
jgi:hypothetical protein